MRVEVLGSVRRQTAGTLEEVRGPKLARVAALLALRAGQAVPLDLLSRELWGDAPPANAAVTLRTHVYHLRRLLAGERDVLRALPGAYLLTLPDDGVDAREFERLADRGRALLGEGRPVEAARRLTAALALWRGPPLGGLAPGPVLSGHVERLTELRARVRELRIEADLARGLHADLVGELRGLVADDPLNEQMQVRLMDALHRCGRRGDALASFHHAQVALHEQLGVEPSHELLDARRRVLAAGAAPLGVPLNGAACSPVPVAHPSLASVTDNDADISWR